MKLLLSCFEGNLAVVLLCINHLRNALTHRSIQIYSIASTYFFDRKGRSLRSKECGPNTFSGICPQPPILIYFPHSSLFAGWHHHCTFRDNITIGRIYWRTFLDPLAQICDVKRFRTSSSKPFSNKIADTNLIF